MRLKIEPNLNILLVPFVALSIFGAILVFHSDAPFIGGFGPELFALGLEGLLIVFAVKFLSDQQNKLLDEKTRKNLKKRCLHVFDPIIYSVVSERDIFMLTGDEKGEYREEWEDLAVNFVERLRLLFTGVDANGEELPAIVKNELAISVAEVAAGMTPMVNRISNSHSITWLSMLQNLQEYAFFPVYYDDTSEPEVHLEALLVNILVFFRLPIDESENLDEIWQSAHEKIRSHKKRCV